MSTPISAEQILAKRRLQNRLAQRKRRQRLQANGRQGSRSSHGSAEFVNAIQADHQLPEGHVENTDWDRNQSVLETQANHPEHPDSSPRGATHNNPTEPMTESWEALLSNLERSESSTLLVDTNQEGNKSTERPLGESPVSILTFIPSKICLR
ncbi:uncharacterized protein BO80DRAFT_215723 [Aspergillus ibericus CBS 121593]|uniref:BZIP domain-containing protein n=1 Tax=Aspergillus ibericus CBS 121593 TaxID=1448316 RepID=A0A395GP75_9EURO|nr:hypothetical protein BO80DRAFT_215723 [Aspergillus ibericus CBS 121593]RAK96758.1 hypothetical protein BO80DRAFT_215723 [Aspergillus ibericus CBS 121593]